MSAAFDFSDYHRTIIGYHGTSAESADRLVAGGDFRESDRDDEWFGKGVYFWEYAPKQAWWWATKFKKYKSPAVVGAMIRLGNCFDLLDPGNVSALVQTKTLMESQVHQTDSLPQNFRQHRKLDCAVFNYFSGKVAESGRAVDSARGVYVPTDSAKRIWPGSWIYEEAHIQICIRNPGNILAVWHVRRDGRRGKEVQT